MLKKGAKLRVNSTFPAQYNANLEILRQEPRDDRTQLSDHLPNNDNLLRIKEWGSKWKRKGIKKIILVSFLIIFLAYLIFLYILFFLYLCISLTPFPLIRRLLFLLISMSVV